MEAQARQELAPGKALVRSLIDGYALAGSVASCGQAPAADGMDDAEEGAAMQEFVLDMAASGDEKLVATSWSDQCIRVYDVQAGLSQQRVAAFQGHTDRITGLTFGDLEGDNTLFSCAEDGVAGVWDQATGRMEQRFSLSGSMGPAPPPLGCVAVGCGNQLVAVGTQEDDESRIAFWDRRSSKVLGEYRDAHVESLTQVCFNPLRKTLLASGSMDGLVCYFDITKPSEDDAMISVLNPKSPVSRLGFFGPELECIFCLTHSETLSLFHAEKAVAMAEFPRLREDLAAAGTPADFLIDCCYVEGAGASSRNQTLILVSGDHEGRVFLSDVTLLGASNLCHVQDKFGHRDDVRAVALLRRDPVTGVPARMLTAGEDGQLCDWRHSSAAAHGSKTVAAASLRPSGKSKPSRRSAGSGRSRPSSRGRQ